MNVQNNKFLACLITFIVSIVLLIIFIVKINNNPVVVFLAMLVFITVANKLAKLITKVDIHKLFGFK